jgi:hypothetical protein
MDRSETGDFSLIGIGLYTVADAKADRLFRLEPQSVRAALRFEQRLAARVAA